MSDSTHSGLSFAPACVRSDSGPSRFGEGVSAPASASFARGLAHLASVSRLGLSGPTRPAAPPRFDPYELADGVGHISDRIAVHSPSPLVGLAPFRL